jgi:hypothetical protein
MIHSVRKRITFGMIFLFMIILVLSVFSGYYLNRLSGKTSAILKENYLSVVYAREMTESIREIEQEMTKAYLNNTAPDSVRVTASLERFGTFLADEKNNITEPGEGKLVDDIGAGFNIYREAVRNSFVSRKTGESMISLQDRSAELDLRLMQLSEKNGKAIEVKTDDAKAFSKRALTRMTLMASICFLIGLSYTYNFASFFNQRIYQLHNGIKNAVESNFEQQLFLEGRRDEFYEISILFNGMAEKLKENERKLSVTLPSEPKKKNFDAEIDELRSITAKIGAIETEAGELISKFEKRKKNGD